MHLGIIPFMLFSYSLIESQIGFCETLNCGKDLLFIAHRQHLTDGLNMD